MMAIVTQRDWTGVAPAYAAWTAVSEDYDGAPDSPTRHDIGFGETEQAAIDDLLRLQMETYCSVWCPKDRREWEDCALVGGCPLGRDECPREEF